MEQAEAKKPITPIHNFILTTIIRKIINRIGIDNRTQMVGRIIIKDNHNIGTITIIKIHTRTMEHSHSWDHKI